MTDSDSFFVTLKSKRESQNIEISEICEFTKIHPRFIESIEKGDFTILPNVYTRLFLKSYANFIGADSVKALKDYELYTTGKITKNEDFNTENVDVLPSSLDPETDTDSNLQISPKQIVLGMGVIFAILILLWWAGRVTQEQAENIESIQLKEKIITESVSDPENEVPQLESHLHEKYSQSITNQEIKGKIENQSVALPNKFPLNDNDFLSEKFYASNSTRDLILSPPYIISVHALEDTKLHLSTFNGEKIEELINKAVPKNWKQSFQFMSTINFEFWSNSQISVKLNATSIDNFLNNSDMAIRGSYEADKYT